jgi:serine/threonine-protein kinase
VADPQPSTSVRRCASCSRTFPEEVRFCPHCGSVLDRDDSAPELTGQIIDGRYRVLELLGEGAMGQVYRADQVQMGRECALKVMKAADLSEAGGVQRFRREASSAARIVHPNIAAVYDFGETPDGRCYLAMEYVAGQPLRKRLEAGGALPVPRAVEIATQVADGLAAAHEFDIVHRDLKPDNIIVTERANGALVAKIIDFGVAKRPAQGGSTLTSTGMIVGTPLYMSPEQFAPDEQVDGRSDLFALGLVLFEMLTGERPYPGVTMAEAMQRLAIPPRTLAEVRPEMAWPAALQAVLDRLLAFDPSDRPATGTEVAALLLDAIPEAASLRQRGSTVTVTPTPRRVTPMPSEPAQPEGRAPAPPAPTPGRGRALVGGLGALAVVAMGAWLAFGRADGSPERTGLSDDAGAPPNGATTTPGGGGIAANRLDAAAFADSLSQLRALLTDTMLAEADAAAGRRRAEMLLPSAAGATDSARVLYLILQADLALDDSTGVCRTLGRLQPVEDGSTVAAQVSAIRALAACARRGTPL